MNEFVSIEILGTIAGCSAIITLLTQIFKRYLPEKIDTKWLALVFSVIVGVLRIFYVGIFDFDNIYIRPGYGLPPGIPGDRGCHG